MQRLSIVTVLTSVVMGAAGAAAQPPDPDWSYAQEPELPRAFIEVFGNWGLNLGQREYVPDGEPGTSRHPFATGFGAGAALGCFIEPGLLSLILDYRFGHTSTREGERAGALTSVQGTLNFHTVTTGLRLENRLGHGNVYAQMAVGVLLPYHTTLTLEYAPELAGIGITGEGTRKDNFGVAFGGHAEFGYHFDLGARMYLGTGLRISAFQGSNVGKATELDNFADLTAAMPTAVTTSINHTKDGPVSPSTGSVQDIRLSLSLGYLF